VVVLEVAEVGFEEGGLRILGDGVDDRLRRKSSSWRSRMTLPKRSSLFSKYRYKPPRESPACSATSIMRAST